jgi:hypothetical protein
MKKGRMYSLLARIFRLKNVFDIDIPQVPEMPKRNGLFEPSMPTKNRPKGVQFVGNRLNRKTIKELNMAKRAEFDKKYTDKITGATGIAVARCEYRTGCVHVQLQPRADKDGKIPDSYWINEFDLIDESGDENFEKDSSKPGGPGDTPPGISHPG